MIDTSTLNIPTKEEYLMERYYDAVCLLDGCYEIIELFQPQSPTQVAWKQSWLEEARKHGASSF